MDSKARFLLWKRVISPHIQKKNDSVWLLEKKIGNVSWAKGIIRINLDYLNRYSQAWKGLNRGDLYSIYMDKLVIDYIVIVGNHTQKWILIYKASFFLDLSNH